MSDLHQRLLAAIEAAALYADSSRWATLRRLAEDRDVLARHKPIQELATTVNHGSQWLTLCAYEWRDGDGLLVRWVDCPDILSLARRHNLDPAAPS